MSQHTRPEVADSCRNGFACTPEISIVVVTWNSAAVLLTLLTSLANAIRSREMELVHVDNASHDRSCEIVRSWTGRLTQLTNSTNRGFAAALKQGIAAARGELLLIVNPDVRVSPGAVEALLSRMRSDSGIGAAGPLIREPSGAVQLMSARRLPSLKEAYLQAVGLRPLVAGRKLDPYTFPVKTYAIERDVPCLSGAAILIRRAALEAAGGVDDRWFMYFEDVDICARLVRTGWRLRYCPAAEVHHATAASSPRDAELRVWLAAQLLAAANLFFAVHRGVGAARAHRIAVAISGVGWILAGELAHAVGREQGELRRRQGVAVARWAVSGRMPPKPV